ncbi:hypothetical protein [Arthrobacter bambusae]|uniref:hypothetical protein n=1 Tax=Arthrobacter bambusae TaxID=1338426 RepID=UPI00278370D5|nr:hypothetical protein [Arthrobacter bambusae]MDQ0028442.1 hypothetical protein [Arthrobacter bambusae]MDQ0096763.1 hypothetical protein [Arthrobacter bambusae]
MAALNETPDQQATAPRGPVFVDESGRRLRTLKFAGLAALGLVAGYVLLLLVAFMGGPNVAAPYLPLPAAANPPAPAPVAPVARDLPFSPSAPPSDSTGLPSGGARLAAPSPTTALEALVTSPVPAAQAPTVASTQQPARFAPGAVPAPSTGRTSPGKSGTAPGKAARPSTPTHP